MKERIAIISKNKLRTAQLYEFLKDYDYKIVTYESVSSFVKHFNDTYINLYILDLEDENHKICEEFENLGKLFLKYQPEERRIFLSEKEDKENAITAYKDFEEVFHLKKAIRLMQAHHCKCLSVLDICRLEERLEILLLNYSFNPKYNGFDYVKETLVYYLTSQKHCIYLTVDVYPTLCEKYSKSMVGIERNIRFFLKSNKLFCEKLIGANPSTKKIIQVLYREIRKDSFINSILTQKQ